MNPLQHITQQINQACRSCGRDPGSVTLVGVSKRQSADAIRELVGFGLRDVGESYVQEALEKQAQLEGVPLVWHFIGPIQSNKTKQIATYFDWVHSVDRLKVLQRLDVQRPDSMAPLNICLQVNIDYDAAKQGCDPVGVVALAEAAKQLQNIRLRGLMCIPSVSGDPVAAFENLALLQADLNAHGFDLDVLSIGMSSDFPQAITAGATMVRVGTALFD